MRTRSGRAVKEVLKEYLGRHGLARRVAQASIVHEWAELVGPQVAKVTEPTSVDSEGRLWVRVASAAWMQELQLMSPTIVRELAVRGKRIKRIRWVLGTVQPPPTPSTRAPNDDTT